MYLGILLAQWCRMAVSASCGWTSFRATLQQYQHARLGCSPLTCDLMLPLLTWDIPPYVRADTTLISSREIPILFAGDGAIVLNSRRHRALIDHWVGRSDCADIGSLLPLAGDLRHPSEIGMVNQHSPCQVVLAGTNTHEFPSETAITLR